MGGGNDGHGGARAHGCFCLVFATSNETSVTSCGKPMRPKLKRVVQLDTRQIVVICEVHQSAADMKGENKCLWLTCGKTTTCGRQCVFDHCFIHRAQVRKGASITFPCRKCGVGILAATGLYQACGGHRVAQKFIKMRENGQKKLRGSACAAASRDELPIRGRVI